MTKIKEMYGTCDGKSILFKYMGRDEWQCIVPADFSDGTYIVDIWAKSQLGQLIYYTAILYMCDGKAVSLQAKKDDVIVVITDNRTFADYIKRISVENVSDEHHAIAIDHIIVKAQVGYEL